MSLKKLRTRDITQSLLKGKVKVPKRTLVAEIYTKLQGWTPCGDDEDDCDEISPDEMDFLVDWMISKKYIYKRGDWIYPGKFPERRKKTHTGRDLLSVQTLHNIEKLESLGFSFGNEVRKVPVSQKMGKRAHSFYVKGNDPKGLSVEYCRHSTRHPMAGQTFLRTPYGRLSVWGLLNNKSVGGVQSRKAVKHYIGIPVWKKSGYRDDQAESAIMGKLKEVKSGLRPGDISSKDVFIAKVNKGHQVPAPDDFDPSGIGYTLRSLKSRGYIEGGPKRGYRLPEPVK